MRRLPLPRRLAVVVAVVVAAFGVVLVIPHAGQAASAQTPQRAHPAAATTTVADVTTATGGLCSVPGIGDIGGLLGFCALGSSGLTGELNNICQPSLPTPEPANAGIDAMIAPPASGKQPSTLYDQYGVAGDYWAATKLQCSDMTSLIGNNVAGMVFDAAKSLDRVTITVYQSAAGEGILGWLQRVTDTLITSLGNAIYFPYLAVVVILGAIWLAWQGLIRKRGTRTIEGTIWMIAACAAALFLIGKPADVTGLGRGVSDGISQTLNVAFAKLPSPGPSSCVPVRKGDPNVQPSSYSYTSGSTVVDQNADELWTVLVCKPWLVGEFGTSEYATGSGKPTLVNTYARSLLWAQAIAVNEKPTPALIQAKQSAYAGIASSIKANDLSVYPLFQGNEWTTRLEVAFAALFAAVVAGVLVLLIAVTLILLKLSFLLLLIVGPFFLLIGVHPGFGRVVALRWVEMLIGVLLKQAAVALVLSLLLYCYALIMGASDAVLPWALKILMIALVTVAAFIYRRPFQHLFSAVGYGVMGSQERAEVDLARAAAAARTNTVNAATAALPGLAAYRAGRWARRNPGQAASLVMAAASGGAAASVAAGLQQGETGTDGSAGANGATTGSAAGAQASAGADGAGGRLALAARGRGAAGAAGAVGAAASEPPPLNLPSRAGRASGAGGSGSGGPAAAGSASAGSASGGSARPGSGWPGAARSGTAPSAVAPSSGATSSTGAGAGVPAQAPGAWPLGRGAPGAALGPGSRAPARDGPAGAGPAASGSAAAAPTPSRQPSRARPAPRQSAPRQVPPRQPSQRQAGQRQAGQRQPSARQPAQRQPSNGSGSQRQSSGARSAAGQGSLGGWLRARWSDSTPPPRQAPVQPGAGRQAQPRRQAPAGRAQPVSGPGAPERQAPGEGQPAGGPLAGPAVEQDRRGPFWLRPVRRK
jgi:TrbL/VirB6 plasmid conjugal transfer protein